MPPAARPRDVKEAVTVSVVVEASESIPRKNRYSRLVKLLSVNEPADAASNALTVLEATTTSFPAPIDHFHALIAQAPEDRDGEKWAVIVVEPLVIAFVTTDQKTAPTAPPPAAA